MSSPADTPPEGHRCTVPVAGRWLLVLASAWLAVGSPGAEASSGGIGGRSGAPGSGTCANACHSGGAYNYSVSLSGPASVSADSTGNAYTLNLLRVGGSIAPVAGYNLSASAGQLTPGANSRSVAGDELTHCDPDDAGCSTVFAWPFTWDAPGNAGSVTFYFCALPGDGTGGLGGDGPARCASRTVNVLGPPPVGNDDRYAVLIDSAATTLDVLANDTSGDTRTLTAVGTPDQGGSVAIVGAGVNNTLSYTPDAGFTGAETFAYTLRDAVGQTATASVTVQVIDPPGFPPADVRLPATGYLTAFTQSAPALNAASLGLRAPLRISAERSGPLRPGRHSITWTLSDADGASVAATQTVDVLPLANFDVAQVLEEGGTHNVRLRLNGPAPEYPVTLDLAESGTAGPDDYTLAGSLVIAAGTEATLSVTAVDDATTAGREGTETLVLSGSNLTNAVFGRRNSHTLSIVDENVAPRVTLAIAQAGAGASGPIALAGGGPVVVSAVLDEPNAGQTHTYDWGASDDVLSDRDAQPGTFTFDPSALASGGYRVALSVADTGLPSASASIDVVVHVRAAAPRLDARNANPDDPDDDDGDGIGDAAEGYSDDDGDGIPGYLDADTLPANVLQDQTGHLPSQRLLETEPGLQLRLGPTSRYAERLGAVVSQQDLEQFGLRGAAVTDAADVPPQTGQVFDFEIAGVAPGGAAEVVLPLRTAVRANAVYRKYTLAGWGVFDTSGDDRVLSAPSSAGICPGPGNTAYREGLSAFHDCVALRLTDGGPNDADGLANGRILDPGRVAVAAALVPAAQTDSVSSGSAAGGWPLWWLLLAVAARRRTGEANRATAERDRC